jgi:PPOX class probable F420-dependent enzyme
VGDDGTPRPNPVWFLWGGADDVLIYTLSTAKRLAHIQRWPRVCLHFNSTESGSDIIVLTGTAEILTTTRRGRQRRLSREVRRGNRADKRQRRGAEFSAPVRVRITHTRGF